MSIRLRLTLWYVLLLCAGLALFAGAILWQTSQSTSASLDDTLRQRAADVAADLNLGPPVSLRADAPDESNRQLGEVSLSIRVLGPDGRVAVAQGPPLPGLSPAMLAALSPGLRDRTMAGGRNARVFILPVARNGRRATVQVITTTHQLEETRGHLLEAMGAAAALIVLAATLGGLFLADRALRPVDRITRLAGRVGAHDLRRRVVDEVWGPRRPAEWRRNDELVRLARTFDAMLARLEEAVERRRRLTADAAHELGAPLATIISGAEIALRHERGAAEYRAALRHILDEGRHLGRVVNDLLLLSQADAGRLPLQRELVEIDEVCRQAVRALGPLATEQGVALSAALPPRATLVVGDELRLGQVVRNLLDNALRYTPRGGAVELAVTVQESGGDATRAPSGGRRRAVTVRVDDTGPGIPPGEEERIFERFHRAGGGGNGDGGKRLGADGSGLGLAICQAIVTAHGGWIGIERERADGHGDGHALARGPGAHVVVALPGVPDDGDDGEGG